MTMHLGRTITTGVIIAVLFIGVFAAMNAGQPLRPDDNADPSNAPGLAFAFLALFSVFSVAVSFGRRSSMHERQREGSGPTFQIVLSEYSLGGILMMGAAQGACLSLALLICRGFAIMMAFGGLESAAPLAGFLAAVLALLISIPLAIGARTLALSTDQE